MTKVKKILSTITTLLMLSLIYFCINIIQMEDTIKVYKTDYATLNSVEFGIFNSDIWTEKITQIIDKKIDNFNLNSSNHTEIRGYVETIIDTLIIEVEQVIKKRNREKHGFINNILGSTKQMITNSIIDFKDLRKRVPEFTDAIMSEMGKSENQKKVKKLIHTKLKSLMHEKFQQHTDTQAYDRIIQKYHTTNLTTCNTLLDTKIDIHQKDMQNIMVTMLFITLTIILLIVFQGTLNFIGILILSSTTITLLISGIMLPMLDIEAKISTLSFTILDQPIVFENQILFFQSKSIYDLVRLLMESHERKMIFVGILLVMFSIIFPMLKLIATSIYFNSKNKISNNRVINFFALKSTKWSMADVFVVSIFMAYLGLDGIMNNELKHFESKSEPMNIITTNATHLEIGFFLFLGFVLTSFVLSTLVENKRKKD